MCDDIFESFLINLYSKYYSGYKQNNATSKMAIAWKMFDSILKDGIFFPEKVREVIKLLAFKRELINFNGL